MPESFGARLRQHREDQQIALVTIAEQTKIKLSLLEALERDDVSHWPSGIFRRAFIRAYAHAIGLNPDVVVREFLEVYPDPEEVIAAAAAALAAKAEEARVTAGPPTRLRNIVGSAIGSLSRLRRPATEELAVPPASVNVAAAIEPVLQPAQPVREPVREEPPIEAVAEPPVANDTAVPEPDLVAVAHLCTQFARVENASDVQPLLHEAAGILDAVGVIVWVWDPIAEELWPALVHGYSDKVLAQLPCVSRDADNATAAAFRSGETCAINGSDRASGALVVPLLTPAGSAGVLAIELQHGRELTGTRRAVATIFAALLAQLIGDPKPAEVRPRAGTIDAPVTNFPTPFFRVSMGR